MNKIEAKRIFSSVLEILKDQNPENFERDYSADLICHLNYETLNLQDLRVRIAFFMETFEVIHAVIEDFIFEDNKAGIRFYAKVKTKEEGVELEDHLFYIYHFEDNQVKESWVYTTFPINIPQEQVKK